MTRYAGAPAQKTCPAGGGSWPAAGGSGALDRDQLAADLGSGTVNRAPAGGGSRVWKQWPAAGGSKKSLVVLRIMASYTIDQLRGTLAAA